MKLTTVHGEVYVIQLYMKGDHKGGVIDSILTSRDGDHCSVKDYRFGICYFFARTLVNWVVLGSRHIKVRLGFVRC